MGTMGRGTLPRVKRNRKDPMNADDAKHMAEAERLIRDGALTLLKMSRVDYPMLMELAEILQRIKAARPADDVERIPATPVSGPLPGCSYCE